MSPQEPFRVTILDRNKQRRLWGNGYRSIFQVVTVVEVAPVCPVCGGPRGTPRLQRYCEDGEWYEVHTWSNACGHVDKYQDVIAEARAREEESDPEAELRRLWTEQGVPVARQDAIIAEVKDKAKPGTRVGPFILRSDERQTNQ